MANLYIIPGFGETTRGKNYREIISFAKKNGYEVVPLNPVWDFEKRISEYVEEISKKIPSITENDVILGFSIGAYILSILSKNQKFKKSIFCTISPFFSETATSIPEETQKFFGAKMMQSMTSQKIPSGQYGDAFFLVGEKDWPLAIETNKKISEGWLGNSKFILVPGAGHELAHPNYASSVIQLL